ALPRRRPRARRGRALRANGWRVPRRDRGRPGTGRLAASRALPPPGLLLAPDLRELAGTDAEPCLPPLRRRPLAARLGQPAVLAAWLLGRRRRVLTGFEQLALLATAGGGFFAERNVVWFALAALQLLPALLTEELGPEPKAEPRAARLNATLAVASLAVLGLL